MLFNANQLIIVTTRLLKSSVNTLKSSSFNYANLKYPLEQDIILRITDNYNKHVSMK